MNAFALRLVTRTLPCLFASLVALALLSGCAMKGTSGSPLVLAGRMKGGQQPVSGATMQLYAVGTTGDASDATPLLTNPVVTDANGDFSLSTATTKDYVCPTPTTLVYLVGTGGNPGLAPGSNNAGIALMSVLGQCGSLSNSTSLVVNEVTTVGAAAALYPYMSVLSDKGNGYTGVGSGTADAAKLATAFALVNEYVDIASGSSPGPTLPAGYDASSTTLNTLANILSTCINSASFTPNDGGHCYNLMNAATNYTSRPYIYPTDTVGAIVSILQNPTTSQGAALFALEPAMGPFQPTLPAKPASWALPITPLTAPPVLSLPSGSYQGTQMLTITDPDPNATIYFTTDGSAPSSGSSYLYVAPIAIENSLNIRAVAFSNSVTSKETVGFYNIFSSITFSPGAGSYTGQQIVTLTPSTPGAQISYTLDGSEPTATSGLYKGPITVSTSQIIKAIVNGSANSGYASATYMITPYATITTYAGNGGAAGYNGNNVPATSAGIGDNFGMAFDPNDTMYVGLWQEPMVRKITPDGIISNFAGVDAFCQYTGCLTSPDGTPAISASLYLPNSVAADGLGNVYFYNYGDSTFKKVGPDGILTTIAGGGSQYFWYNRNVPALQVRIQQACDMVSTRTGDLFFTDCNGLDPENLPGYSLHIITQGTESLISTNGGNPLSDNQPQGYFPNPAYLALDKQNTLFIGNQFSEVTKLVPTTFASGVNAGFTEFVVAGSTAHVSGYSGDGWYGSAALLNTPYGAPGVAVDSMGNVYIGDVSNNVIRKVSPTGIITTVVGTGVAGYSGDGGDATQAQLSGPAKLLVDSHDNLYIADFGNKVIRKVTFSAIKP